MENKLFDNSYEQLFNNRKNYKFKPFVFTQCISSEITGKTKPRPRSGHRIVCDNSNLYMYGGFNPDRDEKTEEGYEPVDLDEVPLFRELWMYNFSSGLWTKLDCKDIPPFLASSAAILSGKVLMIFGGTGVPFGAVCSNMLFICDLSNETHYFKTIETSGDLPLKQYGQAIVLNNNNLYTIGGTTGYVYSLDIHCLNLTSNLWTSIYIGKGRSDEPLGRYRHEVAFNGKQIFILGGGTADNAFGFEEISVFCLTNKKWKVIKANPDKENGYPQRRRCHSCVQYEEIDKRLNAYIFAGNNRTQVLQDIWRLDLNTITWQKLNDFPYPVYFHSTGITPYGKMYTLGGIRCDLMPYRTDDIYSMWLTIPKLKEICWEAITFYIKDIYLLSESKLAEIGILGEYIKRIKFVNKSRKLFSDFSGCAFQM